MKKFASRRHDARESVRAEMCLDAIEREVGPFDAHPCDESARALLLLLLTHTFETACSMLYIDNCGFPGKSIWQSGLSIELGYSRGLTPNAVMVLICAAKRLAKLDCSVTSMPQSGMFASREGDVLLNCCPQFRGEVLTLSYSLERMMAFDRLAGS